MTNLQSVPEQRSWNPELMDFMNFAKLPKKTKLLENFELTDKRGFEFPDKRGFKWISAPNQLPLIT